MKPILKRKPTTIDLTSVPLHEILISTKPNPETPVDLQRIPVMERDRNINHVHSILELVYFRFNVIKSHNHVVYIHTDRIIELTQAQCTRLIVKESPTQQRFMARMLWQFYSSGNLRISDIKYPKYLHWTNHWRAKGLGKVSIDHILPREQFPQLTFDCSNWQPMTLEANQLKNNKW
ncbi:MAG: hypothetical protein ACRDBG_13805 [Waterburya sp.]